MRDFRVLRYLVWVMTINFWGLCPQSPEVYRLETNPEEVKRWVTVHAHIVISTEGRNLKCP